MREKNLDVYFDIEITEEELPTSFSILTAYNPLGKVFNDEENQIANQALGESIRKLPVSAFNVLISTLDKGLNEPAFASMARLHTLYELANNSNQAALYMVDGNDLSLVSCADGEMILISDGFRARVLNFSCENLH